MKGATMRKKLVELAAKAVDYTLSDPPDDVDFDSLVSFAHDVCLDDETISKEMVQPIRSEDFISMLEAMIRFRRSTMDPTVCLKEALNAIYETPTNWNLAREFIDQIIEWLENGGFTPTLTRQEWKQLLSALAAFCDENLQDMGNGGPPYDAATASGMYDRDEG